MARSTSAESKIKIKKKSTSAVKYSHSIRDGSPTAKILIQTGRLGLVSDGSPSRDTVARFAGYKNKEQAGFKKQLSNLKKQGYLDLSHKETMRLTEMGSDYVAPHVGDAPVSNNDFHDCVLEMVTQPKIRSCFRLLADGQTFSKEVVAEKLGYPNPSTAGFKKMLSTAKKEAFVEYVGKYDVRLSDKAFPFGRP